MSARRRWFSRSAPSPGDAGLADLQGHWHVGPRIAGRSREEAEQILFGMVEAGDPQAWPPLVQLLHDQGRQADLNRFREHVAGTASRDQLTRLVDECMSRHEQLGGARFQSALVARFPVDAEALERCAALLAEVGFHDAAMAVQREALRRGIDRPYFPRWPQRTMRALTAGCRFDDAEELANAYRDDQIAACALALLLQVRGRITEAEILLRDLLEARGKPQILYVLFILVQRDRRYAEADALRAHPAWHRTLDHIDPDQRADVSGAPEHHPHWAIWGPVDGVARAFAV